MLVDSRIRLVLLAQGFELMVCNERRWIPACAGMTVLGSENSDCHFHDHKIVIFIDAKS
jgi:hypothetical protein